MPSVDWIYIVVVVVVGLFGDLIILSVRRQQRDAERRRAVLEGGEDSHPASTSRR